jgi:hypothetical protein
MPLNGTWQHVSLHAMLARFWLSELLRNCLKANWTARKINHRKLNWPKLAAQETTKMCFPHFTTFDRKQWIEPNLLMMTEQNPSVAQATNFAERITQLRQTNKPKSARINHKLKTCQNFAAEKLLLQTMKNRANYWELTLNFLKWARFPKMI